MLKPQLQDLLKRQFFSQDYIGLVSVKRDLVLGVLQVENGRLFLTDGIISIATVQHIDSKGLYSKTLGSLVPFERLRGSVCLFKNAQLVLTDGEGFSVPVVDDYLMSMRKSRNFKVTYEKEGFTSGEQSQEAALFLNLAKDTEIQSECVKSNSKSQGSFNKANSETLSKEIIDISTSDSIKKINRGSKKSRRIQKKKQTQNLKKRGMNAVEKKMNTMKIFLTELRENEM